MSPIIRHYARHTATQICGQLKQLLIPTPCFFWALSVCINTMGWKYGSISPSTWLMYSLNNIFQMVFMYFKVEWCLFGTVAFYIQGMQQCIFSGLNLICLCFCVCRPVHTYLQTRDFCSTFQQNGLESLRLPIFSPAFHPVTRKVWESLNFKKQALSNIKYWLASWCLDACSFARGLKRLASGKKCFYQTCAVSCSNLASHLNPTIV